MITKLPQGKAKAGKPPLTKLRNRLQSRTAEEVKCCFANCQEPLLHTIADGFVDELVLQLQEFTKIYPRAKVSVARDDAIADLEAKIAITTCENHQQDIATLFECYERAEHRELVKEEIDKTSKSITTTDDKEKAQAVVKEEPIKKDELDSWPKDEEDSTISLYDIPAYSPPATPPKTPNPRPAIEKEGYFARDRNISSEISTPDSRQSTPGSVFDRSDLVRSSIETPGTDIGDDDEYSKGTKKQTQHNEDRLSTTCKDIKIEQEEDQAELKKRSSREGSQPVNDIKNQIIQSYNDGLKRAKKSRDSYLQALISDASKTGREPGIVYIAVYENPHDASLENCCKIGWTKNPLEVRYANDACDRRHNMRFLKFDATERPYVGAHRVERLLHLDFYSERRKVAKCAFCKLGPGKTEKSHDEWFEIETWQVIDRLRLWKAFVTVPGMYDDLGRMTDKGSLRLNAILNPVSLITAMLSDWHGDVPDGEHTTLIPLACTPKEDEMIRDNAIHVTPPPGGDSSSRQTKHLPVIRARNEATDSPSAARRARMLNTMPKIVVSDQNLRSLSSDAAKNDIKKTRDLKEEVREGDDEEEELKEEEVKEEEEEEEAEQQDDADHRLLFTGTTERRPLDG